MHGYLSIRDNAEMNSNFRLYLSPFPNRKSVGIKNVARSDDEILWRLARSDPEIYTLDIGEGE